MMNKAKKKVIEAQAIEEITPLYLIEPVLQANTLKQFRKTCKSFSTKKNRMNGVLI